MPVAEAVAVGRLATADAKHRRGPIERLLGF